MRGSLDTNAILRLIVGDDAAQARKVTQLLSKANSQVAVADIALTEAIYVLQRRTTPPTMMEVFDQPPMTPNCIERSYSTVSTQALQMMNSEMIRERARFLAGRLIDEHPADRVRQVESLYQRALARKPSAAESAAALADLDRLTTYWREHLDTKRSAGPRELDARWSALGSLCHAILSSAEFLYVE